MLLEVILALAVFAAAAVGLVVALHRTGEAATLIKNEMRITRILESALDETLSLPVLEEGEHAVTVGRDSETVELLTTIKKLEELETEEGQILQDMFLITVTAVWRDGSTPKERAAETWRYGRMYQP